MMSRMMTAISAFLLVLCCAPAALAEKPAPFPTLEELFAKVRDIDCKGTRLKSFANHCSSLGKNPGCADPNDVCYVKSGLFSQCRPVGRTLPTCWDRIEAVKCKGDKLPVIPPGPTKGIPCIPSHSTATAKPKAPKEHDDPTPNDPEGTNCSAADMAKGCRCAGRFWKCADRNDLITQACDIGLECIRKNPFYAVCATPARKKWAIEEAGWEGTSLPCNVNVGQFGFS